MKYFLMIYADESGFAKLTPEQQQSGMAAYMAYTEALKTARVYVSSNRLQSVATATTVHVSDGRTQVHDGPFIDTREQFAGSI